MKLTKYYDKINAIYESFDELMGELEETRDAIKDKAIDRGRDMTEREQHRFDELDFTIGAIKNCKDNLEYAISEIEDYCV